ncbi:MAG: metallophosphoesterase, partial [bacterium]
MAKFIILTSILVFFPDYSAALITRHPFVQPTDNMENSMGVAWRTDQLTGSKINYRKAGEQTWSEIAAPVEFVVHQVEFSTDPLEALESRNSEADYEFQVKSDNGAYSSTYSFKIKDYTFEYPWMAPLSDIRTSGLRKVWGPESVVVCVPHDDDRTIVNLKKKAPAGVQQVNFRYRKKGETSWRKEEAGNPESRFYVKFTDLEPGTKYEYKVDNETTVNHFTTSSKDEDFSYRVLLLADNHFDAFGGTYTDRFNSCLPDLIAYEPHMVFHQGDFAFGPGAWGASSEEYSTAMNNGKELFSNSILCVYLGNHDSDENSWAYGIAGDEFYFPVNGPNGLAGRDYIKEVVYSFNYGMVHFAPVTIANHPFGYSSAKGMADKPVEWLEMDLIKAIGNGARNIITGGHSMFPGSDYGVTPVINLLDKYNAAACFYGHLHAHHRSYPLYMGTNSIPAPTTQEPENYGTDVKGTVYQMIAATSFKMSPSPSNQFKLASEGYGFSEMDIRKGGREIEVRTYTKSGHCTGPKTLIDRYVINRDISV